MQDKTYLYFINELTMPKPDNYHQFTVMLYTQIVSDGSDPVKVASSTLSEETVSASAAFFGESSIDSSLWMINQYSTKGSGDETTKETLYYATGTWNN